MKKLTVLLFSFILIFAGCNKQNDLLPETSTDLQLKSAESKTINFEMQDMFPGWIYYAPLICDGDTVDILEENVPGEEISVHVTAHFIEDKMVWAKLHCKGTLTSKETGEIFKVNDQTRVTFDENMELTSNIYHVHALGDRGTQIMNFYELDYEAQTFVLTKSICPQSDY